MSLLAGELQPDAGQRFPLPVVIGLRGQDHPCPGVGVGARGGVAVLQRHAGQTNVQQRPQGVVAHGRGDGHAKEQVGHRQHGRVPHRGQLDQVGHPDAGELATDGLDLPGQFHPGIQLHVQQAQALPPQLQGAGRVTPAVLDGHHQSMQRRLLALVGCMGERRPKQRLPTDGIAGVESAFHRQVVQRQHGPMMGAPALVAQQRQGSARVGQGGYQRSGATGALGGPPVQLGQIDPFGRILDQIGPLVQMVDDVQQRLVRARVAWTTQPCPQRSSDGEPHAVGGQRARQRVGRRLDAIVRIPIPDRARR